MVWAYGSYAGGRLLVLVATAILARLLTPAEFGLVALAVVFTELLNTLRDLGVTQALVITPRDEVHERAETAFVVAVGLGLVLSLGTAAIAPLAAAFFDQPQLSGMLAALGATFFIRSLGATHYALAQKALDFRSRTAAELADAIMRGGASIGFAMAGAGAWSLIAGYIVGTLAMTITLWTLVRWRPRGNPRRAHLRHLIGFGGTITGVEIFGAFNQNVDYILTGRALGAGALGLYTLAYRLPSLVISNLAIVAGQVLFPAYAEVDRKELGRTALVAMRYTLFVALPMTALLSILADPFILVAFGDQWGQSVLPMQILTIYACSQSTTIAIGVAYKAMGRADVLLKLIVPRTLVLVAALVLFVDDGIVAVAACQASVTVFFDLIMVGLATRLLHVSAGEILRAVWPPVVAAAAMAPSLLAVNAFIDPAPLTLLAGAALGGATYAGSLWLVAPNALRRLGELARPAAAPTAPGGGGAPPSGDPPAPIL